MKTAASHAAVVPYALSKARQTGKDYSGQARLHPLYAWLYT